MGGETGADDRRSAGIDVSVIIVSWNVREFLRDCLTSIRETRNDTSVEIIVVDNSSEDGSPEMVRSEFREVRLIATGSNLGFGRANNLGLAGARGRYVFFLNPDTVLQDGVLGQMIAFLDQEPRFDVVGPRLVDPDGTVQRVSARNLPSVTLELFIALYLHRLPFIGLRIENRLISRYDMNKSQEVEAISGAAMLARRAIIQKAGGFDESFLHTAEDIDLCLRLRQMGARIFFLADSPVVHFGGRSTAGASARAGTMSAISMFEYYRRWHGRGYAQLYRLINQFVRVPLLLAVGVAKMLVEKDRAGFDERLRFAKAIWAWRVSD
jgi:GT2 family glycosyltransferase